MSIQIKVCGMTDFNQVQSLADMHIDFAGFIFYPKSSRYVSDKISAEEIKKISGMHISAVGVFVDEDIESLINVVDKWKLDYVQLHGNESPDYCKHVSTYCKVIKAFRVGAEDRLDEKTRGYEHVDSFLFDTKAELHGGTGLKFDWNQLLVPLSRPYFLSGGIGLDDVVRINDFIATADHMFAVDVNSQFETAPGFKDLEKVLQFKQYLNNDSHA
ncbi:MAG: phosphoribosylanthranilate isomerase [Bacteroidota bacterium]